MTKMNIQEPPESPPEPPPPPPDPATPEIEIISESGGIVNPEVEKALWPWKCGVFAMFFLLVPFVVLTLVGPWKARQHCEERIQEVQKSCVVHTLEVVPEHCTMAAKYVLGRCTMESRDD